MAERGYTLSKAERLSWKRYIDLLFLRGQSFVAYPLRVVYLPVEETLSVPVSFLVSVPKKKFKRAVKLNLVKRQVREESANRDYTMRWLFPASSCWLHSFIWIKKLLRFRKWKSP